MAKKLTAKDKEALVPFDDDPLKIYDQSAEFRRKKLEEIHCFEVQEIFFKSGNLASQYTQKRDTVIFLNFDRFCNLHQLSGPEGEAVRDFIVKEIKKIFWEVFTSQLDPVLAEKYLTEVIFLRELCEVRLIITPQDELYTEMENIGLSNNGEVQIVFQSTTFKEDFLMKVLMQFKERMKENPLRVKIKEKEYEILFSGWGVRYD